MKVINKKCEVVCDFLKDGKLKPVRLRVLNEEESYVVIVIKKVIKQDLVKEQGKHIIKFVCEGEVHNTLKIFELRFYKEDTTWVLFKI